METSDAVTAKLESALSDDERAHAALLRFHHLRRSFVIRRGVLRCLLGRYLGVNPESIRFNYGSKGKPALASAPNIEFNTSHSGNLAVFALTVGCPVGVDVEQIRPLLEIQAIADRFFCKEEAAEIMSLSPNDHQRSFFCCWTRKEAYVKASGDGLSAPLDEFRVTVQPTEPARLVHIAQDRTAADTWTLHDLSPTGGYVAALAYPDRPRPLSIFPIASPDEFISTP